MKSAPFARSLAVIQAIASLLGQGVSEAAAARMVPYSSRGHGQGKYSGKKKGNACTNWKAKLNGNTNGKRECERRIRQMARAA